MLLLQKYADFPGHAPCQLRKFLETGNAKGVAEPDPIADMIAFIDAADSTAALRSIPAMAPAQHR